MRRYSARSLRLTGESISQRVTVPPCAQRPFSSPPRLNGSQPRDGGSPRSRCGRARGAQLVLLPEKWSVLGRGEDLRAGAEPLDGPAVSWARAIARELGIDLVAGSVAERIEGEPKLRNTCVHVGPDGEIAATYRKIHLFDVEVEGTVYRESDHEEPGDEPVLSRTAGRRPGRPQRLLRRPLPRALPRARGRGRAHPHRARRPSPCRPRAITGRCCCAPGRSRTSAS